MDNEFETLKKKVDMLEQFYLSMHNSAQIDPVIAKAIGGAMKLSFLSDVENTNTTTTGYVLKKTATTWQPAPDIDT